MIRFISFLVILFVAACGENGANELPKVVIDGQNAARVPVAQVPLSELPPEQRVEQFAFKRWANHPVGTNVRFKEVTAGKQQRYESRTTYTILSRSDNEAIVKTQSTMFDADGKANPNEPLDQRYSRWARASNDQERARYGEPNGTFEKEETLTILGKEYQTRVYKSKGMVEAGETEARLWITFDIPGAIAKSEIRIVSTGQVLTSAVAEITMP